MGAHAGHHIDLVVEQHGPLWIRLRRWIGDKLMRRTRKIEIQLPAGILEDRTQLHKLGDQRPESAGGREPRVGKRDRHPRPRRGHPEGTEILEVRWAVEIFNQKDELVATYELLTMNVP